MNKTPRADKYEQHWIESGNARKLIELTRQLETELADMRERFKEYVEAQESRDVTSGKDHVMACVKAVQLHNKAKEVLGL